MVFNLTAKKRKSGKAEEERAAGLIPGVFYGPQVESTAIALDYNTFAKLYSEAGESTLIDLDIEGAKEPVKVLVQDVQHDPLNQRIVHVDFRQIRMDVVMTAEVVLHFVGEAPAVKSLGGTLVKAHQHIKVKCLPKDLVSDLKVDIAVLKTFTDMIHVRDLVLPPGITALDSADMVIAKVNAPLTEEQLKAMEEEGKKGVESVVEVEKKEKKEEEVAEEGAAPAAGAAPAKKEEKK